MKNPAKDLIEALAAGPKEGGYTANDFEEAIEMLPDDVTLPIPWCFREYVRDADGNLVMEETFDELGNVVDTEKVPVRRSRMDVLKILAYFPARVHEPDITVEEIGKRINHENIRDVIDSTYAFWGVDLPALRAEAEAGTREASAENPIPNPPESSPQETEEPDQQY